MAIICLVAYRFDAVNLCGGRMLTIMLALQSYGPHVDHFKYEDSPSEGRTENLSGFRYFSQSARASTFLGRGARVSKRCIFGSRALAVLGGTFSDFPYSEPFEAYSAVVTAHVAGNGPKKRRQHGGVRSFADDMQGGLAWWPVTVFHRFGETQRRVPGLQ